MKRIVAFFGCCFFALAGAEPAGDASWSTIVVGKQSTPERLATVDLQRYLAEVTGRVPQVLSSAEWHKKPRPAVVLGTPEDNPLVGELGFGETRNLGEEGYWLSDQTRNELRLVVAAGEERMGAVNAVYGLLRSLGFGFYLGSESKPAELSGAIGGEGRTPVFKIRGVLPWYNFFNSPTAWDPIDHRAFVDQLIRMGANFVGFHSYDVEPFAAVEEDGAMKYGEPLFNTKTPTWGTHSMKTSEFGCDTSAFFKDEYFGAESTLMGKRRDETIRLEQDILRDALDYAHKRGLRTCLGFEYSGDPLDPKVRDIFLKRLNHVLDQYPSLDYVWIWQPEVIGVTGYKPGSEAAESTLPLYGIARRDAFRRVVERTAGERPFFQNTDSGKRARALEGARMEQFAMLAHRAISHRQNGPRLVVSGWGGDERLLSAEYYEALDKLLPPDVVFASLDHISPRERVDRIYHELPSNRERWPIPWLENDGDQWHPQPYVHTYEKLVRDAHASGSQGIVGIHWRTRDVEENFAYLMQYAWDPTLTADGFFADYAARCYGAVRMGEIHHDLDAMGYRWVGGSGQGECAPFSWGPGEPAKAERLERLYDELVGMADDCEPPSEHLWWMAHRTAFVLKYQEAEANAVRVRELLGQAKAAPTEEERRRLAEEARAILDGGSLWEALTQYVDTVTTRGEYGVLATMNTKAVVDWRGLRAECFSVLGESDPGEPWHSAGYFHEILHPRFLGSVREGEALDLWPIVRRGAKAFVHCRRVGERRWQTLPLEESPTAVRHAAIPAKAVRAPGLELGFSFEESPNEPMEYGPVTVTVMPATEVDTVPPAARLVTCDGTLKVTAQEGARVPVELTWDAVPDADFFRVSRDGAVLAETAVAMFPDVLGGSSGTYRVEALRDGQVIARSEPLAVESKPEPVTETPQLVLHVNSTGITLELAAPASLHVTGYAIERAPEAGGRSEHLADLPQRLDAPQTYRDVPPAGHWTYTVAAVNAAGERGPAATVTADFPPPARTAPDIDLPLTVRPEGATVNGLTSFGEKGLSLNGGSVSLPHQACMDLGTGMTLDFECAADDVNGMPVLISHGMWQGDGWFVQILGGKLVLRAPNGDAVGPTVEVGKAYAVRVVFDGVHLRMRVNGEWLEQDGTTIRPVAFERPLVIGAYEPSALQYPFRGRIANLRIWSDAVVD